MRIRLKKPKLAEGPLRFETKNRLEGYHCTENLAEATKSYANNIPALTEIRDRLRAYVRMLSLYRQVQKNPLVGQRIHEAVDREIEEKPAPNSCRRGCHHCCYIHVTTTKPEVARIVQAVEEKGIQIDMERLRRQADYGTPDEWSQLDPKHRACVFLDDDGDCRIYDVRPSTCRLHFSAGDPDLCNTLIHPKGKITVAATIPAEIVYSAAMTVFDRGSLARLLLEELG